MAVIIRLRKQVQRGLRDELERARFFIQWFGVLGLIAHPSYYFLCTYVLPQPYDNLLLRLSAAAVCVPLALQKYWPKRFQNCLPIYWHCCLIYVLPFVCTFLTIKNSFSAMWMMTEVMMIIILAVCINSHVLLMSYLVIGALAGFVAATVTATFPLVLSKTDEASLALLPIIILCSMVFSRAIQKVLLEKNKALHALAGSIAHEMRNPLGQLEYTLDNIEKMLPMPTVSDFPQALPIEKLNALYQHLSQGKIAVKRGLQSISMILDEVHAKPLDAARFAYVSAGKITQKGVDEYSYESEEERSKVSVKIENDFTFKGNETLYLFILFKLIKNALYYFKPHPQATLMITVDRPMIKVRDTGPGIPKDFLPDLFDAFQTSGKAEGAGLGLAYCKRVMRAFGGDIVCVSNLGESTEYTEFTLSFPDVSPLELKAYQQSIVQRAEATLKDKRILVVDDNAIQRKIMQHILNTLGCNIDEAENGQLALEQLKRAQYDLIVMDLNMPVLDGYAAAARIRAGVVPDQKNIPIVAYSSESAHMAQVKIQKVGMNNFVSKSCSRLELVKVLADTLEHTAQTSYIDVAAVLAGKTVLLAEDNAINRTLLKTNLQAWHMHVIEAEHGYAVLEQLEKLPLPDVILMDINMPGLNGRETTRAIRAKTSAYQQIAIIALTGDSSEASIKAAYAAGFNDFVTKPIETKALCEKLGRQFLVKHTDQHSAESAAPNHKRARTETEISVPLLNTARLEEIRSIDMLDSCIPYYLTQTEILLKRLSRSVNAQDFESLHQTLHTFLGISGEVGAVALHQFIRRIYPSVENGYWSREENWLAQIESLSAKTCQALREGYMP
jgi:two-component system CAI-1 autoinducer sensor kinase/phosphatase CqsS